MLNGSALRKNWWKYALLVAIVVLPVELLAYVAGRVLLSRQLLYAPQPAEGYEAYLADRDPVLGWPGRSANGQGERDASGSRLVPRFPDPALPSCIALYGDSFTWGDEVAPEHAYGNVLAGRLGCRVANYGVGGYGTDQALLRYMERIDDPAPVVVLGHFSENVVRNVNQLRDFIAGGRFGLKPRFVVDATGQLQHVPLPDLTKAQYADIGERAGELLPYDYFRPGGPSGTALFSAPYTLAVVRALGHYRIQAHLQDAPSYAGFYAQDHPSDGLRVTTAIIRRFVDTATARGQRPVVVVIPDGKDLLALESEGRLPYAPLLEALKQQGIHTPKVAEQMLAHAGEGNVCSLYTRCGGNAHFNPDGYAQLARVVHAWLKEQQLVPVIERVAAKDVAANRDVGAPSAEGGGEPVSLEAAPQP